jgi:hypothetical protein
LNGIEALTVDEAKLQSIVAHCWCTLEQPTFACPIEFRLKDCDLTRVDVSFSRAASFTQFCKFERAALQKSRALFFRFSRAPLERAHGFLEASKECPQICSLTVHKIMKFALFRSLRLGHIGLSRALIERAHGFLEASQECQRGPSGGP